MKALAVVCPPRISFSSCSNSSWQQRHLRLQSKPKSQLRICSRFRVSSCLIKEGERQKHKGGVVDELLLNVFRNKMVKQVGWDSHKPGYDGLIEVANRMMLNNPTNSDTKEAAVRVLISLFPPFLLELYKLLIAPIQGGKIAAFMVARVTAISCQWLMGPCTVNSVDLPDGNSWTSGVFVEKCKYLEESKCVGICVNTCKLPTQSFFKDYMGVPLLMEPNFNDYSCQFKFGVLPPLPEDDAALKEPCLAICPNATRRRERNINIEQCPKA
ncbi:putative beta-carotene isomerase [Rosa chinensis]|uniref:Putative beta-carotene isomerase n=1 Tax=Rosa chinensis TaxID=74649 RepID=A0A2P6RFK1_ROSCH|nr:beta-carotene isomerase D27, chloroplastic isoform X1 [Rosa chinensis]PRQ45184.1 putative beta-carotene isomerase [Rosa chinensis]